MNRALTILCVATVLAFTIGCSASGYIPGSILDHSSTSCASHGGTEYIKVVAGDKKGNLILEGDYVKMPHGHGTSIPCTDVLVMCGDNFTELNYDTCDAKWWPATKEE
jgi:hypothetical protein